MSLPRVVAPETLDGLAADDPAARRSRRDLRRVHRFMRTVPIVVRALRPLVTAPRTVPLRMIELGAGDGTLMLAVARAIGQPAVPIALTLLDRLSLVEQATLDGYAEAGWHADVEVADVVDWSAATSPIRADLIVANLFLHHFEGFALANLLDAIARRGDRLFACEPRRALFALAAARLTGVIGANAVTREDAVLSVHAGFREGELGAAWPVAPGWTLREYAAGPFSHCFEAVRDLAGAAVGAAA